MEFLLVLAMNMFGHLLLVVYVMRMVLVIIIILISLDLLEMITLVVMLDICGGLSSVIHIPHGSSNGCQLQQLT